jgi:hypothetical protein
MGQPCFTDKGKETVEVIWGRSWRGGIHSDLASESVLQTNHFTISHPNLCVRKNNNNVFEEVESICHLPNTYKFVFSNLLGFFFLFFVFFFFETWSCCIAQTGLKLEIRMLFQYPECQDYRYRPLGPAHIYTFTCKVYSPLNAFSGELYSSFLQSQSLFLSPTSSFPHLPGEPASIFFFNLPRFVLLLSA